MQKISILIVLVLALGLIYSCGEKKEEAAVEKPAETKMVKDVVCGMDVDPTKTTITAEYEGKTYYFCAEECKVKFEANPTQYTMASKEEHGHEHEHGEGQEHKH